ncbi:MAG: hypothetical protein ABSG28_03645 [Methanoregula sp.]|uniref:hypothetical protein n=1 Tax=Methanoregula sp. TaxID=2052170 RepID=UPI003C14BDCD
MRQSCTCATRGRRQGAGSSRQFPEQQESERIRGPGGSGNRAGIKESDALPPPLRERGAV